MIQVRFLKLAEHLSWRIRNCIRLFLQETVFDILTVLPYQEQKTFRRQVNNLSQTECFLLSKGMVFVWVVSVVSIFAIKMSIKAKLLLRFLNQAELAKVLCRRDCQERNRRWSLWLISGRSWANQYWWWGTSGPWGPFRQLRLLQLLETALWKGHNELILWLNVLPAASLL